MKQKSNRPQFKKNQTELEKKVETSKVILCLEQNCFMIKKDHFFNIPKKSLTTIRKNFYFKIVYLQVKTRLTGWPLVYGGKTSPGTSFFDNFSLN